MSLIHVRKGRYNSIIIRDCTFKLLEPININKGITYALVDCADLIGPKNTKATIVIEDFKLI